MRNPFRLKNSLEDREMETFSPTEGLSFEEQILDDYSAGTLERGGEFTPRVKSLLALIFAVFFILFGRFYYLAVAQHEYYRTIAEGNRLRTEYSPAPRGAIYDINYETLAGNKPSYELVSSPIDLPENESERKELFAKLAGLLLIPEGEIEAAISSQQIFGFEPILIRQNLSREQALVFLERDADFPGFRVVRTPIRDYKESLDYAHLIGYVGKINAKEYQEKKLEGYLYNDSTGKTGLEQVYETNLRGKFAERQVEVDARGIVKKIFGEKDALPGENLILNVDAGLQQKLYESLTQRLRVLNRRKAAAIVMNPQTGQIMAYLSLPSYDNNAFAEGITSEDYQKLVTDKDLPLFNRAIGGTYPPGSTVKPMVAAAALEEKVITPNTVINDEGQIVVKNVFGGPDYYFIGFRRIALGLLTVRKAIALSSDVFFYIVGGGHDLEKIQGLGIAKLAEFYRKFGLGKKLGIDLPGEQDGLVPDPEWKKQYFGDDPIASKWYLGDTYHVSIGQGDLLASPLQVLSWISAVANGGKIYKPYIVDRIEDNDKYVIKKFEPEIIGDVGISRETLGVVKEGMRQAVLEGTAKSLGALPITSAAKTGTAQFDAKHPERSHAWFTAFAPYENPQIAIVVLIEDGGEGGVNSMPVVRDTLNWWALNRYLK